MQQFEDEFSEAQTEMISRAVEYAENSVSDVFVQFIIFAGLRGGDAFFVKDGTLYSRQELPGVDVSKDRQLTLLHAIADEAHRISLACKEFNRPIPAEGYLRYRVDIGSLDASYSYDAEIEPYDFHVHTSAKLEEWKQFVQKELDAVG